MIGTPINCIAAPWQVCLQAGYNYNWYGGTDGHVAKASVPKQTVWPCSLVWPHRVGTQPYLCHGMKRASPAWNNATCSVVCYFNPDNWWCVWPIWSSVERSGPRVAGYRILCCCSACQRSPTAAVLWVYWWNSPAHRKTNSKPKNNVQWSQTSSLYYVSGMYMYVSIISIDYG